MEWKVASPDRYSLLKEFARKNRKFMTDAESLLWSTLRKETLNRKFLRQYIIGDYIVDFYCRGARLVIEVDGAYHSEPKQQEDDQIRQSWLEQQGYRVIRFTNDEVIYNTEKVLEKIYESINS